MIGGGRAARTLHRVALGAAVGAAGIAQVACGSEDAISDAEARAKYGRDLQVLAREQTAAERAEGAAAVERAVSELVPGENLALRRRVDVPGASGPVFVWPAERSVCYADRGGASCKPVRVIRKAGGVDVSVSGGGMQIGAGTALISGIALDGIDEVTIARARQREITAPVVDNIFVAELGAGASKRTKVTWTDAEGEPQSRSVGNLGPSPRRAGSGELDSHDLVP